MTTSGSPLGFQGVPSLVFDNRYGSPPTTAPEVLVTGSVTIQYHVVR